MNRLYSESGTIAEIDALPNREEISKKVIAVGQAASREAADILDWCIEDVRKQIEEGGVAQLHFCKRTTIERSWQISAEVTAASKKKSSSFQREIGILIDERGITPWAWSRGGRAIEGEIARCLPKGTVWYPSKSYGDWNSGSIGLKTTPIPWQEAVAFELPLGDLIKETKKVVNALGPSFIHKFLEIK